MLRPALFVLLLIICLPLALGARDEGTGCIEGTVFNSGGDPVRARLRIRNTLHGDTWNIATDSRGFYRLDGLRPGRYSAWATDQQGNSVWIREILVIAGECTHRDIRFTRESIYATIAEFPAQKHPGRVL